MKTCYVIKEYRAIADLVKPYTVTPGWTITRINVPKQYRGKGIGSKLLKMILEDADSGCIPTELYIQVSPSDGLNYYQLTDWYMRYGFKLSQSGYMLRAVDK